MRGRVITIGGPPGSGKTTAARTVADALHREYHSAGEVFRAQAALRGLNLADFGKLAEADPDIDRALDEAMVLKAGPHALLEGRIIGELLERRRVPVFRVLVTARQEVRAQRIARRDGGTAEDALAALRVREQSERARYLRYYDIDLGHLESDLVVDATVAGPAEVVRRIVSGLPLEVRESPGPD